MIASGAIVATISSGTVPPETPMNTSAPAITSARLPVRPVTSAVTSAIALLESLSAPREEASTPVRSTTATSRMPGREQDPRDRDARGTGAGDDHAGGLHQPAGQA